MKKIFKYNLSYIQDELYASIPDMKVIRTDYVDDGFYKGNFIWGIVDTDKLQTSLQRIDAKPPEEVDINEDTLNSIPIGVCEKQIVRCSEDAELKAFSHEGRFYLMEIDGSLHKFKDVEIVMYKTGQEIKENIDDLEFIGCCRLWIMQELMLYVFINHAYVG